MSNSNTSGDNAATSAAQHDAGSASQPGAGSHRTDVTKAGDNAAKGDGQAASPQAAATEQPVGTQQRAAGSGMTYRGTVLNRDGSVTIYSSGHGAAVAHIAVPSDHASGYSTVTTVVDFSDAAAMKIPAVKRRASTKNARA